MKRLRETINTEIANAMKAHDKDLLYVLQWIKNAFINIRTAKGFNESNFNDALEVKTLQKIEKEWVEELEAFKTAGRDVSEKEKRLNILKSFLPEQVSNEDIKNAICESGIEPIPKNTRSIMTYVQEKYPTATGKQISDVMKTL